jgi:hypothetical protein
MRRLNLLIITATLGFGLVSCSSDSIRDSITEAVIESQTGEDVEVESDGDGNMVIKGENGEEININVDADGEGGSLSVKDENGEEVNFSTDTKIPDDFPSNIYVIDGERKGVVNMTTDEGKMVNFAISVDDDIASVSEKIKDEMNKNDWKASANMMGTGDDGGIQMYTNEKNQVQIIISKDGDKTVVAYSVTYITE